MKIGRILSWVLIFAAGAVFGFASKTWLAREAPPRYSIQVSGVPVVGELSRLLCSDIEAIKKEAARIDSDYALMQIEFLAPDKVEIMTGAVRGPLDGGGRFFTLQKKDGRWVQVDTESHRAWVS